MRNYGWLGYIPAVGTEKHAYRNTIAKTVPIPDVAYGFSAPFRSQGNKPYCGFYSFCEAHYGEMQRVGLEPVLLDPLDLAESYKKETGSNDGVYNRVMLEVAAKYGVLGEDGKRYYIDAWHEVDLSNKDEVFNCLAERRTIIAGFPVYRKAFDEATNGLTTMPERGDVWLGGHDCSFKGYIKKPKMPIYFDEPVVIGENHWDEWGFGPNNPPGWEGDAYGEEGNFLMPLAVLVKYGADAWTISLA